MSPVRWRIPVGLMAALLLACLLAVGPATADSREDQLGEAWAAYDAGDDATARALFESLANEGDAEANYGLGLMDSAGRGAPRDEAAAAEHFSTAANAGIAGAQDALGYAYDFGLGLPLNHDLAEYWYQRATDAGVVNAKNNLAYSWIDSGRNIDQALAMLQDVLSAVPNEPAYLDSYGWALYQLRRYPEALHYLCDAAMHDPGHPEVQAHLGDAFWQMGQTSQAVQQWQRALDLADRPDELSDSGADFLNGFGLKAWKNDLIGRLMRAGNRAGPSEDAVPLPTACNEPPIS
ncbi:tetratricopeptide repeat protein [Hypericibacter sp.]|uniref:tetratricopeptide repeat protein n=1 Tax=Hypericibacter sp. TaxID=2705401 RepID=UPI003D6CF7A8